MDQFRLLMEHQLTEKEIMVFLLLDSGALTANKLAKVLMVDNKTVTRWYDRAAAKFNSLAEAGLLSTPVGKKS